MKKKPIYNDIYLLFPSGIFFEGEFYSFLRAFGRDSRKCRRTDDYLIWYSISGKGFLVWFSEARTWSHEDEYKRRIVLSLAGNNVHGIVLQHLIPYLAIQRWRELEILMPENCNVFKTASDYLIFAKQAVLNRATLEDLSKYGYIDEQGEVYLKIL